jgi:hypothetical protein
MRVRLARYGWFLVPSLFGCYTYAPIEPDTMRAGTSVRARITSAAADRLATLLGTSETRIITGTLINPGPDTIIVEIPAVMNATTGGSTRTLHQRVAISRAELIEMETRTLNRLRTGVVAGSAIVILAGAVINAIKEDPGTERSPGGGGGGEFRAP